MKFYHGTDQEIACLKQNSYVSKNFKDASKFGYRRAVLSNSPFVYIYIAEIDILGNFLKNDQNRDRAYVTLCPIKVELMSRYPTYKTLFKLKKFKKENEIRKGEGR